MKYLLVVFLSTSLYATDPRNECGDTLEEYDTSETYCLYNNGRETRSSRFDDNGEPEIGLFTEQSAEEFEEEWELVR